MYVSVLNKKDDYTSTFIHDPGLIQNHEIH